MNDKNLLWFGFGSYKEAVFKLDIVLLEHMLKHPKEIWMDAIDAETHFIKLGKC